jgi:hypothetical protein
MFRLNSFFNPEYVVLRGRNKIRKAMGERDTGYTLAGIVELDDAFFGAPTEGGKRGHGTDQAKVLVGLSLNEKGQHGAPIEVKQSLLGHEESETTRFYAQLRVGFEKSFIKSIFKTT